MDTLSPSPLRLASSAWPCPAGSEAGLYGAVSRSEQAEYTYSQGDLSLRTIYGQEQIFLHCLPNGAAR